MKKNASEVEIYPATVVKILDEFTVVINRGKEDGIGSGREFVVYSAGEEIFDPQTKESLGFLEYVKGTGTVTYLQERMAHIRSNKFGKAKRPIMANPFDLTPSRFEIVDVRVPLDNPVEGDLVKPV